MIQDKTPPEPADILLYQTEGGQKRMAEFFQKNVRTINEHIRNIFTEGELAPGSVIRKFRITADDRKKGGRI